MGRGLPTNTIDDVRAFDEAARADADLPAEEVHARVQAMKGAISRPAEPEPAPAHPWEHPASCPVCEHSWHGGETCTVQTVAEDGNSSCICRWPEERPPAEPVEVEDPWAGRKDLA